MITFTLDLEDHRPNDKYKKRYPEITRQVLSLLDENSVKGTFFVVGAIANDTPDLIKEIANKGHELAFHSYAHQQLQDETPERFKQETALGKKILEDISGQEVIGYRAPVFSLTKNTMWALDTLSELGFKYSSSVLPASNPLNGFPDVPKNPFYWPNDLLEIPVPVANIGPVSIPYLGGVYLRYLPKSLIKKIIELSNGKNLWTYCHPYDFDSDEPFFKIKGAGLLTSLILWFNRSNTQDKISFLLSLNRENNPAMTFSAQYAAGVFKNAKKISI